MFKKFNEMSSPETENFGTFEWDVLYCFSGDANLLDAWVIYFDILCVFFLWQGKSPFGEDFLNCEISGVNSYWPGLTLVKQYGVFAFGGPSPNEPCCATLAVWKDIWRRLRPDNKWYMSSYPTCLCNPTPATCDCGWIFPDTYILWWSFYIPALDTESKLPMTYHLSPIPDFSYIGLLELYWFISPSLRIPVSSPPPTVLTRWPLLF